LTQLKSQRENHHNLDYEEIVIMTFKENLKGKIKLDRLL